jgi:hypothetical protein
LADFAEKCRECLQWQKQNSTFFVFYEMKDKEDIECFEFLNSAWLSDLRGLPNFTVPRIEYREFLIS